MNVVIMGVQGSGKGTQAKQLGEETGMKHINMGEIFRYEISERTSTGEAAQEFILKGELVPDELTIEMMTHAVGEKEDGLIFDGFPRSPKQTEYLIDRFKDIHVIVLELKDEEALRRISARRHCSHCKRDYNLLYSPPQVEGYCNFCGGRLEMRADDKPQEVKRRIEIYRTESHKVLEILEDKVIIDRIDASEGVEDIYQIMETCLGL